MAIEKVSQSRSGPQQCNM